MNCVQKNFYMPRDMADSFEELAMRLSTVPPYKVVKFSDIARKACANFLRDHYPAPMAPLPDTTGSCDRVVSSSGTVWCMTCNTRWIGTEEDECQRAAV